MYAIVEIAGQQFKVEEGKKIFVHRLDAVGDETVDFEKVLLIEDEDNVTIGEPTIKDAVVEGKILDHVRGDKVIVFKKKKKKGYRVKNGHRQNFTQIEIINILKDKSATRNASPKAEEPKVTRSKASEEPVKKSKETLKKTVAKKPVAKKVVKEKSQGKKAVEKKPVAKKSSKGKK